MGVRIPPGAPKEIVNQKAIIMDIRGGAKWPASSLSNFAPHPFVIDGVECASMEGFLQSLKFKNSEMQKEVCKLVGKAAKFKGKPKKWWRDQKLYWQGQTLDRHGSEYRGLLDKAYDELTKNTGFQKALLATGDASLSHSIGKSNTSQTILTSSEFIAILTRIRAELQKRNR